MAEKKAIEHSLNHFAVEVAEIWKDKEQIKLLFAPDLTQKEFDVFCGLGMSLGANPFNREIWAVKYKDRAQIFTGRDFKRKKAQEFPDYNGHVSVVVYENDEYYYDIAAGMPVHAPAKRKDRGEIVGAYGLAWRKGIDRPFYVFCEFSEYDKGFSLWKGTEKPATMIKKVAEDQVLSMAWQAKFQGTYGEFEQWKDEHKEAKEKYQQEVPTKSHDADVVDGAVVGEEEVVDLRTVLGERLSAEFEEKGDRSSFVKSSCGKSVWKDLTDDDLKKVADALDRFQGVEG